MKRRWIIIPSVILIALFAGVIRYQGIAWGLPNSLHYFSYHPDETALLFSALTVNLLDGQLDTGFYNYGSLYIYLASISVLISTLAGLIDLSSGEIFENIGEFAKLYLAGRALTLALGALTAVLVYILAKNAYGRKVGLLAAAFFAVTPLHVMHSKFMTVDAPATFFVALALIFAVRITHGQRLRDYLLAGLFAGLAAGTKYNAGLVIAAPLIAHLICDKPHFIRRIFSLKLAVIPFMAVVGFLIGTPGAVLHTQSFLRDFKYELAHASAGHGLVFEGTRIGFIHHYTDSMLPGMGIGLLALASLGIICALRKRAKGDIILLAFLAAYYLVIGLAEVKFARYIIPILPVFVIFAARFSVEFITLARKGRAGKFGAFISAAFVGLAFLYAAAYSQALNQVYTATDTRDQAALWVRENILPGSTIGLPTIPWFYTPPLDPYFGYLSASDRMERTHELTDYILVVSEYSEWDSAFLEREDPDYVIISEFEYVDRLRLEKANPEEYLKAKEYFDILEREYLATECFRKELNIFGKQLPMIGSLPHDMSYASPTILIYTRKAEN